MVCSKAAEAPDDGRWLPGKTGLAWSVGDVFAERIEATGEPAERCADDDKALRGGSEAEEAIGTE